MKYNFDAIYNRAEHDSKKWFNPRLENSPLHTKTENFIPMWIADMDFATPDCVIDAIKSRCDHPIFGYFEPAQPFYDAINKWHNTRYDVEYKIENKNILYENSVLGAVASFISAYTLPAEALLVNSSVYPGFQNTIANLGRKTCNSPLILDENGIYRMDFEDMEQKIVEQKLTTFIFCSPHNPTGRVWERWEIEKVVKMCDKYDLKLLSDEIWADFIMTDKSKHIPTQTISSRAKEITMAVYAPSKTFNLAGLVAGYSVIFNETMLSRISKFAFSTHYNEPNVLSCHALVGAYEHGAEWVDEMNKYIRANQEYIAQYINENFDGVSTYLPEGTYLLWLDFSKHTRNFDELFKEMIEIGILPNSGDAYLAKNFMRLNLACPRVYCEQALERLSKILG